ncbi:dTDP-4-dehydrorhamnose reductase [Sphingomonas kaistensis]|uniref:dTDP-4-dehydrorhamnose reductase n=1 Tax=Sphingomonas kaistensis TaxID=298708 RepID=A0A7X5Y7W7_9SPHN|nr:dTDP-4-dehydrorhamnose reductase [Sphingomonas kaistensis]NJC06480.1 dTDP-4-dehydrorhamnose reductase [Sphingomonas kaistensis]
MKVLVTGRDGQLARSLAERSAGLTDLDLVFAARPGCDLATKGSVAAAVRDTRPDLVISAAAYTAVDKAEQEPELAHRINAEAASELAEAAAAVGAPLIHVSTDYVFGGTGAAPMREDEPIAPLGVYGRTKAEGERRVREGQGDHLILRTAWVYSPFGANFVKTMLRLSRDREEIAVVADQVGSPTNALDLADVILALAERRHAGDRTGWGQTFHAAGSGRASWADFAAEIMRLGGSATRIRPIPTSDFPTPAQRPAWSVLDGGKLRDSFGLSLPDWRASLPAVVERLVSAETD